MTPYLCLQDIASNFGAQSSSSRVPETRSSGPRVFAFAVEFGFLTPRIFKSSGLHYFGLSSKVETQQKLGSLIPSLGSSPRSLEPSFFPAFESEDKTSSSSSHSSRTSSLRVTQSESKSLKSSLSLSPVSLGFPILSFPLHSGL